MDFQNGDERWSGSPAKHGIAPLQSILAIYQSLPANPASPQSRFFERNSLHTNEQRIPVRLRPRAVDAAVVRWFVSQRCTSPNIPEHSIGGSFCPEELWGSERLGSSSHLPSIAPNCHADCARYADALHLERPLGVWKVDQVLYSSLQVPVTSCAVQQTISPWLEVFQELPEPKCNPLRHARIL